ncbi:hypothetical protein QYE76_048783 [Lolium multiflorum]|uniref:DUF4218 domain-containing protein n=1 Tax=Lolium multiflorum TaxID=4521 RepID=A0AAD8WFQ1_LOLMU|nr:hypothetical protein QYE76_048783 [Lolium multiflorum]
MVHLLVHIVEDISQLGSTFLHSMMPFERMNGVIKGYVRNRARPDGSIAKGFLTEECISFTSYLEIENPIGLPVNRHLGKLAGWGHREGSREMHVDFKGRIADFERANLVALQHIDVVDPWVVEHKTFIAKTYNDQGQQRTDGDIIKEHNSTFTRWFKDKMLTNPSKEIFSELDEIKTGFLFFHEASEHRKDQREPCGPQMIGRRGLGLAAPAYGVVAPSTLRLRLFAYKKPLDLKPRYGKTTVQETFQSRRHREAKIWGTGVSVPAPCRSGEVPPEGFSIDTAAISTAIFITAAPMRRE